MKTLKSNGTSFGILDFLPNGRPRNSSNDGYTNADDMKTTGIWKVSGSSSSTMYVSNLPGTNQSGFLIVLDYDDTISTQIFITTATAPKMYTRTYRSSAWGSWYLTTSSEVTA